MAFRAGVFWQGVRDTTPMLVGAAPFGVIFGALAVSAGLSAWGALALSGVVFAGSSQFVAVSLMAAGAALHKGDVVRTGKPGSAGMVLTDDTTISLGSGSEIALNDYVFQPRDGQFALALKMVKGTFAYVTGQIVRLSPASAQVLTPDATIAVRGTKLLIQIEE